MDYKIKTGMRRLLIVLLFLLVPAGLVRAEGTDRCSVFSGEVALEGGVVHYHRAGDGPAVLLLHGVFANKEQWDAVVCRLSNTGYTTIAPDLPGYGKSEGFPVGDYALERQVALLHEFVERLGIERFDVAGNSMGGTIAALLLRTHPGKVRSLAFIGGPLGVTDWGPRLRQAILRGINPFIPVTVDQFDLEIGLLFATPPSVPPEVKEALVAGYIRRNGRYQQVWNIVNLYDEAFAHWTENRDVPTLVLWGQEDAIFPAAGAQRLKGTFPLARVLIQPSTGHLPHVEKAAETAAVYLDFLAAHAACFEGMDK